MKSIELDIQEALQDSLIVAQAKAIVAMKDAILETYRLLDELEYEEAYQLLKEVKETLPNG